ncbi:MAG: hypothetical protein E2O52_05835 [Gammaproteobacteria bacterium]|nr:MAG: hypothetical protein E2O52_05835 [Gammaproteobacteria bacterium]
MTVFNGLNIWPRLSATAIIANLLFSAPILIYAQDSERETDQATQLATIDFVVGNAVFILLHEFGHVVIRDFDIPILGLEENAADTLAAIGLILADENQSERQPRLSEYLAMAVLGNLLIWQTGIEKSSNEILFWAQHEVSVRRATRLVCLLYGSDTREFGWLAEAVEMPESRRDVCEDEFTIARNAAEKVLATFGKSVEDNPELERTEIEVKYGRPRNPTQARLLEVIQETQLMETVAKRIRNRWVLPDSVTLRVRSCPSANAYWDEDYRELIFCLELLEALEKIGSGPEVQRLKANFAKARD